MTENGGLTHKGIRTWVDEIAAMTQPDRVLDLRRFRRGSETNSSRRCLATGELIELNQQKMPGCYLHRSAPHDVARTEHLTFVCTSQTRTTRAPTTTGCRPPTRIAKLTPLFTGAMKGRTMYVVPFLMGPPGIALLQGRRRDHRQQVRRPQHAHHDARGPGRARSPRRVGRLHALPALARRSQPRSPLHHALPREEHRLVDRVGLRRQRAARQEVHGAAPRELARPRRKAGSPSTC